MERNGQVTRLTFGLGRSARRPLVAAVAALLWACGGHEVDSELAADPATVTDTCRASTLDWPLGATEDQRVCSGAWEYQCCDLGNQTENTCKHADTVSNWAYRETQTGSSCATVCTSYKEVCRSMCPVTGCEGDPCTEVCATWGYRCSWPGCTGTDAALKSRALNAVSAADTGCLDRAAPPTILGVSAPPLITSTTRETCTVTVANVPVGHDGTVNKCDTIAHGAYCGWSNRLYDRCDFTVTNKDGTSPSLASNSLCTQPSMYTAANLPFSSVKMVTLDGRVRNTPKCSTCEGTSYLGATPGNPAVQGKYACLQDSLTRLGTNAQATGKVPDLAKRLVQRAELEYELFGTQLTALQQPNARSLYTTYPTYTPACGQDPSLSLSPTCSGDGTVIGKLTMCDRLRDEHAPLALAQQEAAYCVDAWNDVKALAASAPSCSALTGYKAGWVQESTEILRKAMRVMSVPQASRKTELQARMALTGRWFENRKAVGDDRLLLWRDAEIVTGSLAQGAYYDRTRALDVVPPGDVTTRDALIGGSWTIDHEILNALLDDYGATGKPPLAGKRAGPAVFLLADALTATSERLNEADFQHDLGCRFLACGKTRVSEMHRALGAIPSPAELDAAWRDAGDVPAAWKDLFYKLWDRHDEVVQPAVLDALGMDPANLSLYGPDLVRGADPKSVGVFALSRVTNPSQAKAARYAQSGRFRSADTLALETNLLESTLAVVREKVGYYKNELEADRTGYQDAFAGLIDAQLTFVNAENDASQLVAQIQARSQLTLDALDDIDALRVSATMDAERFGDFALQYQKLVEALEKSAGDGPYLQSDASSFTASPFDARWRTGAVRPNVPGLAVKAIPVTQGQIVRVEVSGQWSPTCAIGEAAGGFNPPLANFAGAMTGSQGYQIGYSSSNRTYTAEHTDTTEFSDTDKALKGAGAVGGALTGIGAATGNLPVAAVGAIISVGASIADLFFGGGGGGDTSTTSSEGWENSYQSTAAFNHGLRVKTSPFKKFPAGALLAVRMREGTWEDADILDVDVVQNPSTAIVVASKNAADTRQDPLLRGERQVLLRRPRRRLAGRARRDGDDPHPAQGRGQGGAGRDGEVVPEHPGADRGLPGAAGQDPGHGSGEAARRIAEHALHRLHRRGDRGHDLRSLDVQLERPHLLQRLGLGAAQPGRATGGDERPRPPGSDARHRARRAGRAGGGKARVSQGANLMASRDLLNLDATAMRSNSEMLVKVLDVYLYPFLRGKYPETLQGDGSLVGLLADADAQSKFNLISTQLDWTLGWDQHAKNLVAATEKIQDKLNEADMRYATNLGQVKQTTVVLAIRKPDSVPPKLEPGQLACETQPEPLGCSTTCVPCELPGWPEGCTEACVPCATPGAPEGCTPDSVLAEADIGWGQYLSNGKAIFREMSPALAREVWRQIVQGEPVQLVVAPEDLYQNENVTQPQFARQLACTQLYPVIVAAGLQAATDEGFPADTYDLNPLFVPAHASRDLTIATPGALEHFFGANDAWLNFPLTVLAGYANQAPELFATVPKSGVVKALGAGEGLSAILPKLTLEAGYRDVLDPAHLVTDSTGSREHRHTMALLLVLEVEYRNAGKKPTWLSTRCRP